MKAWQEHAKLKTDIQVKDAKFFEKTRIASWGKLSTAALIDIARICLESGDDAEAHSWLKKIPDDEIFQTDERDKTAGGNLPEAGRFRKTDDASGQSMRGASYEETGIRHKSDRTKQQKKQEE